MSVPIPQAATLERLDQLLAEMKGRRFGVLGLGVAGRAMASYLLRRGAQVLAADRHQVEAAGALRQMGAELRFGDMGADTFDSVLGLIISPGVDPRQDAVRAVMDRGLPVFGELELVGSLPAAVAAITGTNGKSTTTALLGQLVESAERRAFVGGNFGEPIASWLDREEAVDVAVLELSSFQLETAFRFKADVGVVLNITPDHSERYESLQTYADAKARLIANLGEGGFAVLNHDDPYVRAMARLTQARVLWLSTRGQVSGDGAFLGENRVRATGSAALLDGFDLAHPTLLGRHNRENALAALLAVHALGLASESTLAAFGRGYQAFAGLEHRLQTVAEIGGVLFVNDSKATNDEAAAIAVSAMDRPVILLAGGRDKGAGFEALVAACETQARHVIAYGEARDTIASALQGHRNVETCTGMEQAFAAAARSARPGDAVLLAPACASFDEFANYEERGRAFKALVQALGKEFP